MRSYVISTDSSADLSEAYLKEHQITMISLSCILNGKIYNSENPITPKQLYDNIYSGRSHANNITGESGAGKSSI